jgi:signal transduction histidine kinase
MILDMFADKITDKEVKEMLNDISQSSIRLIDIVNDFLEVSRLEQGKVEIKFETFNTKDLLKKVVRDLQSRLIAGVTLTIKDPEAVIPDVRADKGKIEQILINLIGNSVKFTAKGSILVSTDVIDKFLKISVTDTGLGISEANQLRLFRKFQQAGEQMLARDVTQGTGLGLYISQLLTSKMGGSIGVEKSVLGVGSTFAFTIPIAN